jgi:hypothetical protein
VRSDGLAQKETTTVATTTQSAFIEHTEVKLNAAGDLAAFMSAIQLNVAMAAFCVVCFIFLQRWYPYMYCYRWFDQDGTKFNAEKIAEEQGYFGWISKAWNTPCLMLDQQRMQKNNPESTVPMSIEEGSGLDAAMLMKFTDLALELSIAIGVPALLLFAPIYAFAGGDMAGEDSLSYPGIGNVVYNNSFMTDLPMDPLLAPKLESTQWIFYTVAVAVWVVIIYVMHRMKSYQQLFIRARMDWLLRMPEPRSTTVLVQGIDAEKGWNTNEKLKQYFEILFGQGTVQGAFVIVKTGNLAYNQALYKSLYEEIVQIEVDIGIAQGDESVAEGTVEQKKSELEEKKTQLKAKEKEILEEQDAVQKDPACLSTNGFVTFKKRQDAERALGVNLCEDSDAWTLETPPAPDDVRYSDFEYSDELATTSQLIGYGLVAVLFFTFMPIVIGVSNLSLAIESTPWLESFLDSTGMKSTVDGTLQTIGLTIMMSMLPTFLVWVFQATYTLKADRWAQIQIQIYYFWFLVLFVLLTTSVGSNLTATLSTLAESPFEVFSLLAEMMPVTTHFYLNYVILQPVTHAMNLMRYINLTKFIIFRKYVDEDKAHEMAEPEDQDYYGIGSRSARFALMLLIGLVFGTICPLMNLVTLYNFICCRFIYGYLIPFQENRKDDMGGVHWCIQINHMQLGLLIYLVMMTGILAERAETLAPCIISACSFLWWAIMYRYFHSTLRWEKLPYVEIVKDYKPMSTNAVYEQPELVWKPVQLKA